MGRRVADGEVGAPDVGVVDLDERLTHQGRRGASRGRDHVRLLSCQCASIGTNTLVLPHLGYPHALHFVCTHLPFHMGDCIINKMIQSQTAFMVNVYFKSSSINFASAPFHVRVLRHWASERKQRVHQTLTWKWLIPSASLGAPQARVRGLSSELGQLGKSLPCSRPLRKQILVLKATLSLPIYVNLHHPLCSTRGEMTIQN